MKSESLYHCNIKMIHWYYCHVGRRETKVVILLLGEMLFVALQNAVSTFCFSVTQVIIFFTCPVGKWIFFYL